MTLYGKDTLKSVLDGAAAKGRLSHAIMFSGSKGSGRSAMARYTAQLFLCGEHACGKCKICRAVESDAHPDVIFVKKSLPEGKYLADPLRGVLRDTAVRPNDGDIKIYVFEKCDDMQPVIYNMLLKLIEEPAPYLRFIFTAESTGTIPETIMSRVTEYEVPDMSVTDCVRCLTDRGVDRRKAEELAELYSGNIGRCMTVLSGADKESAAELAAIESARRAAHALGERNPVGTAAALSGQTGRTALPEMFRIFSNILRDALAVRNGGEPESLAKEDSRRIAQAYSDEQLVAMLDAAIEVEEDALCNVNAALIVSYFMSRAFG